MPRQFFRRVTDVGVPPQVYVVVGRRIGFFYPPPNDGRGAAVVPTVVIPVPMIYFGDTPMI